MVCLCVCKSLNCLVYPAHRERECMYTIRAFVDVSTKKPPITWLLCVRAIYVFSRFRSATIIQLVYRSTLYVLLLLLFWLLLNVFRFFSFSFCHSRCVCVCAFFRLPFDIRVYQVLGILTRLWCFLMYLYFVFYIISYTWPMLFCSVGSFSFGVSPCANSTKMNVSMTFCRCYSIDVLWYAVCVSFSFFLSLFIQRKKWKTIWPIYWK